jgi:hypothetical protein
VPPSASTPRSDLSTWNKHTGADAPTQLGADDRKIAIAIAGPRAELASAHRSKRSCGIAPAHDSCVAIAIVTPADGRGQKQSRDMWAHTRAASLLLSSDSRSQIAGRESRQSGCFWVQAEVVPDSSIGVDIGHFA